MRQPRKGKQVPRASKMSQKHPHADCGQCHRTPKLNKQTDTKVLPQVNAGFMTMALVS